MPLFLDYLKGQSKNNGIIREEKKSLKLFNSL